MNGYEPENRIFASFNPNWGNIRGGFPPQMFGSGITGATLPLSGTYADLTEALEKLGSAVVWGARVGDWSVLKPSLGAGPLESGVFDRPEPEVPSVLYGPVGGGGARVSHATDGFAGPLPSSEEEVIVQDDAEYAPGFEPGGTWHHEGSDFETPPIRAEEDADVAVDWGRVLSGAIDIAQGQTIGGASQSFVGSPTAVGAGMPREVTVDTVTGEVKKCKRRRRRRLLTPTDLSDLAALQAIVGKGDALKLAVAKAVRR